MTKENEEKEPRFKVVDRRRFTESGDEALENTPAEEERSTSKADFKINEEKTRPQITFSLFVQSLAHQSMMALGIAPWPDSGLIRQDLIVAKETIDILQILKDKTVGNLSAEEAHLMENLVYQLKVAFVEIAKRPVEEK